LTKPDATPAAVLVDEDDAAFLKRAAAERLASSPAIAA
jgi:hypothetical protein